MVHYFTWALAFVLYAPLLHQFYYPIWLGLKKGPTAFINSFSMPWGHVADYTHAYFILPISLWLIWRNRVKIKDAIANSHNSVITSISGLIILAFGVLLLFFGMQQEYVFVSSLSILPFLSGLIMFLYGNIVFKIFAFPIFYLFFLIPPPAAILDSITLPMRHGISILTEVILSFINYPMSRDGLLLTIGYQDIFMGQPCSGFRSLITMFALVLVYVYISKGGTAKKVILGTFIVPFALFGNLLRVIILCLITFYFGEEVGQGFFHNFSGIMIFIITLLGILGLESILERRRAIAHSS